jgi:hypothetical protein
MSIEDVFKKNNWYVPIAILNKKPCEFTRDYIAYLYRNSSDEAQISVRYKEKGRVVCDIILRHCFDIEGRTLSVWRDLDPEGQGTGGAFVKSRHLDGYLEGVHELYLEFKDKQHEFGIGIEYSPEGSKLGHYMTMKTQ